MAIIYSYPRITPTPSDLLLVSDNSVQGNPTKTVSINDVLALVPSGGGGGGISSITSNNTNFLSVTNPTGPFVTLDLQVGTVQQGGNTLATTGDIYNFTTTSITNAINALGPVGSVNSFSCSIASIPAFTATVINPTTNPSLTIGRTGGQPGEFLDYTGNWSSPSVQGMTFWELTADTGGSDKVEEGNLVNIEGVQKISTQLRIPSQGQYFITVSHDVQSQNDTTITKTLTNGESFFALSGKVGVDTTGHVTGQQITEYTLPTNAINSIGVDAPIQNTGTASDPVIDIEEADGTTDGYLSSTDWTTFNDKQTEISLSVNGTSGAATFNAATGALNIPVYSGGGGGGVSGVGLDVSAFNALSVTMQGGGPNPITGSDTFVVGINGASGATEYLDGSGNWSTPAGVGTDLSNTPGINSVEIISSTGSPTTILAATQSIAGVMTTADKTKLDGIAAGAEVNVQSNWAETDTANDSFIQNKPTIPTQFSWTLDGDSGTPQVIADSSTVNIVGTGAVSTAISGNTLTISSSASGSGTVTSIDAADTTFITGVASTSPSPITTTGTLEYSLSAVGPTNNTVGNPDSSCFLRGDNKWATFTMGQGIFITKTISAPFSTTIKVNYNGAQNVVKSANPAPAAGVDLSDTIIMNDATNSQVYEATLQSIKDAIVTSRAPTYFSVNKAGNILNSGNISDNTQGFGTITTALAASGDAIEVTFGTTQSGTSYIVNFTLEEQQIDSGNNYAPRGYVASGGKNTGGFTISYVKPGSSSSLGDPVLTNFQLYK